MRVMHLKALVIAVSFAISVCACSTSISSQSIPRATAPASTPSPSAKPLAAAGRATLHLRIPGPQSDFVRRHRDFIGTDTQGLLITGSPYNPTITPATFDLSSASPLCTADAGNRECTITFGLPPGSFYLTFTTYDAPPVNGSFANAKQLGTGTSQIVTVTTNGSVTVNAEIGGTIATIAFTPPALSLDGALPGSYTLGVSALDADGETILTGTAYYSNPITYTISETSGGGHTTFVDAQGSSFTSGAQGGLPIKYAPQQPAYAFDSGYSISAVPYAAKITAAATGVPSVTEQFAPLFVTPAQATGTGSFTNFVNITAVSTTAGCCVAAYTDAVELNFTALSQSETLTPSGGIGPITATLDPLCPANTISVSSVGGAFTVAPIGIGTCNLALSDGLTTVNVQVASLPTDGSQHYLYVAAAGNVSIFPANVMGTYVTKPIGVVPPPVNLYEENFQSFNTLMVDSTYHLYPQIIAYPVGPEQTYDGLAGYPPNPIGIEVPTNFGQVSDPASIGLDLQDRLYAVYAPLLETSYLAVYSTKPTLGINVEGFPAVAPGIAVDSNYNVYAASDGTVSVYPASDANTNDPPSTTLKTTQSGVNFEGVALDTSGRIYVVDTGNNDVAIFPALGSLVGTYSETPVTIPVGTGLGNGIAIDPTGRVAVEVGNDVNFYAAVPAGATGQQSSAPVAVVGGGSTGFGTPTGIAIR